MDKSFLKEERVKINAPVELHERSASFIKDALLHYLHLGEIFECTAHCQPAFMEYLNVYCNKRQKHFVLPMNIVERVNG